MKFEHLNYLPIIIITILVLGYMFLRQEGNFFRSVKLYWFYERSWTNRISSLFLLIGFSFLIFGLLDLRGPEERIKAQAPVERTIILIDTSASMLAEDIKPSRLEKAVLLAKHYARKATGQQLSVVVFSEIQKKLVPFTNDLDLIDSRLESIKNLRNHNGSSALTMAIQESIQHLKEAGSETGNLLVFTDGEETAADIGLKVPETIKLALVGIGTERGGRIPLDDGRGLRYGYKKYKGQDVITKLDEKFFKQIESKIQHSKYWINTTYNLPTEEIVEYFKSSDPSALQKEQEMVIKPVMMEYIVLPALLIIGLGYLLRFFKAFIVLFLFLNFQIIQAQDKEAPPLAPDAQSALNRFKEGNISSEEKVKLSEDLLRTKSIDESIAVFEEARKESNEELSAESRFNYATALLQKDKIKEAALEYSKLEDQLDDSEESKKIKSSIKENMKKYFQKKEEEKKKQEQDKKNQKKEGNNKDQKENDQKNQGQSSSSNEDQQKDSQSGKSENDQEPQQDQKDNKGDNKEEKNNESEPDDQKDKDSQTNESKENEKPKPKNMSPKLKQLMSDDRQLQLRMIEQGTKDMNRRQNRENKDW